MTSLPEMAKLDPMAKQGTTFCFTLCNPTEEEILFLQTKQEQFTFIIAELATARTTGTPHLQGYFEVINKIRMSTAKRMRKQMNMKGKRQVLKIVRQRLYVSQNMIVTGHNLHNLGTLKIERGIRFSKYKL
jgi:hypothetical protein